MICRGQAIGLILIGVGVGLLLGCLLTSWLLVGLLSAALIAAGVLLLR